MRPWLGFRLFGESFFAVRAGEGLILQPLLLIFRYFLILYVAQGNLLLLFAGAFFFQESLFPYFSIAYLPLFFQPLVWLAFFELLRRKDRPSAIVFSMLAFGSAALSLEAGVTLLATSLVLALVDRRAFGRTALVYLLLGSVFALFLHRHEALLPYLRDIRASVWERPFVHGYPLDSRYQWALFLPIFSVFLVWGKVFLKHRRAMTLDHWDWGMVAIALYVCLAFQKFLGTPDGHLWEITSECLPILVWAALPLLRHRVSYPIGVLGMALVYPHSPMDRAQLLTNQFTRVIDRPSTVERLGLLGPMPEFETKARDFQRVFKDRILPGDTVYDLTNSKGLFYYLLDQRPVGRFVYTGHHLSEQEEVIAEMEKNPPKLVVYSGGSFWTQGGVPGSVRYWKVSAYLLDRYEPLVVMHDYLILQRKTKDASPTLYSFVPSCDWGYAPFLFREKQKAERGSTLVDVADKASVDSLEISFEETVEGELVLRDAGAQAIRIRTAAGGPATLRIPVASCPQWRLFTGDKVFLEQHPGQRLAGMRVIRK